VIFVSCSDFFRSARYRNFKLNSLEKFLRLPVFFSHPVALQLELTNQCDLRCITCARTYRSFDKEPVFFPVEDLNLLKPLLRHASELTLGGYGEPMRHPEFAGILKTLLKEDYLKISLITNGLRVKELGDSVKRLHRVILSLDGCAEVFEKHRGVSFEHMETSLRWLAQHMDSRPGLEVHTVWNRLTHEQLPVLVRYLNRYPVSALHLLAENMYHKDRLKHSVFHPEKLSEIRKLIDEIKGIARFPVYHPRMDSGSAKCNQPLDTVFITAKEELLACCSAVFSDNPWRFPFSHLKENGLFFLKWNSPRMILWRLRRFFGLPFSTPCDICSFRNLNLSTLSRFD
jgi:MoaA/NifB/PqqE/SkfB family radical SAM enzyme